MKNMMNMMKQAKEMQKNMEVVKQKLAQTEVTGAAGGKAVEVTMTCDHAVRRVAIAPAAVDTNDLETLEDMVQTALNDALQRVQQTAENEMKAITGGMQLPGLG